MQISIEDSVLKKYPRIEIGYLIATVKVKEKDPFVENLKKSLAQHVQEQGMNATNFVVHPKLSIWRKIYKEDFQVKETTYRSSVEALMRRVVTGKELWNICNVVDLYNCCSILSLLPMGGYDFNKIAGDIRIRYAKEGESFYGIGQKSKIQTEPHHLVYADDQRVMCWLWNHKDAYETCIDENSQQVVFFIDSADGFQSDTIQKALVQLSTHLESIESSILGSGVLNANRPQAIYP